MKAHIIRHIRGEVRRDHVGDTRYGEWVHIPFFTGRDLDGLPVYRIVSRWRWHPLGQLAAARDSRRADACARLERWAWLRARRRFGWFAWLWWAFRPLFPLRSLVSLPFARVFGRHTGRPLGR